MKKQLTEIEAKAIAKKATEELLPLIGKALRNNGIGCTYPLGLAHIIGPHLEVSIDIYLQVHGDPDREPEQILDLPPFLRP